MYVAVGTRITAEESEILAQPLPWGAEIVRKPAAIRKAFWYLENALVDLEVCRHASWFVGYGLSTFSQKVAEFRAGAGSVEWYAACPLGLTKLDHSSGYDCLQSDKFGKGRPPGL